MRCNYCGSTLYEYDEYICGLCPECYDMALDDWRKEIEFIEVTNRKDDFYVGYYFNVSSDDFDPQLMFVCRKFILNELELHNADTKARLRNYIEGNDEEYIKWWNQHLILEV